MTPDKYERDAKNLTSAWSKIVLTEKLTNGALVTSTPAWHHTLIRPTSASEFVKRCAVIFAFLMIANTALFLTLFNRAISQTLICFSNKTIMVELAQLIWLETAFRNKCSVNNIYSYCCNNHKGDDVFCGLLSFMVYCVLWFIASQSVLIVLVFVYIRNSSVIHLLAISIKVPNWALYIIQTGWTAWATRCMILEYRLPPIRVQITSNGGINGTGIQN